jgi:serine/threonine protein kinase
MADIKLSNIMLQIEDTVVLSAFEKAEQTSPSPRKVINSERTIYASRRLSRPRAHMLGPPVLCDFGEARIGTSFAFEEIQPEVYKAPEILLQIEWNSAVDLWNVACLVRLLYTNGQSQVSGADRSPGMGNDPSATSV